MAKDNDNLIPLLVIIAGAVFLLPKILKAEETQPGMITPTGGLKTEFRELKDISGATWNVPIYLTVERDIRFGFFLFDWLGTAASTIGSGLSTVGSAVGTLLHDVSAPIYGAVEAVLINPAKTVGNYLLEGADKIWSGVKTVGGKAWDAVVGVKDYFVEHPNLAKAAKATLELAAITVPALTAGKGNDISSVVLYPVSTNSQYVPSLPSQPAQLTAVQEQTVMLGYLSSTPFPDALLVKKLWHAEYKDTYIVADGEALNKAIAIGYQQVATLGYASSIAFRGCTPLIALFKEEWIDHIVISNPDMIAPLESTGYKNVGYIGYIKAVES